MATRAASQRLTASVLKQLEQASLEAAHRCLDRAGYHFLTVEDLARRLQDRACQEYRRGGTGLVGDKSREQMARLAQTIYSEALYAGCRSTNAREQNHAYAELGAYLYRAACHLVCTRGLPLDLAHDCTQEALERIWRKIGSCRQPGAFLKWAIVVLVHQAGHSLEREPCHLPLPEED